MEVTNENTKVQHVTKKSSDELLRKFAELESDPADEAAARKELRLAKRRRRVAGKLRGSDNGSGSLVEIKWLLPPATRRCALVRQLGIGRSMIKARDLRNKSFIGTIEKTWRKTVEGASRVFMEKHYNRHRRLINDAA
ncbi:uncharacterized protein LOC110811761 [Carica papaya]|uniref:uncharacterized protein LOC110811761 n=1 Tax=Carica papaya TaxID=3649 RepID=UPI000B8D0A67|nr:uncharacterized protein LOC110811761 [Carica papaya]